MVHASLLGLPTRTAVSPSTSQSRCGMRAAMTLDSFFMASSTIDRAGARRSGWMKMSHCARRSCIPAAPGTVETCSSNSRDRSSRHVVSRVGPATSRQIWIPGTCLMTSGRLESSACIEAVSSPVPRIAMDGPRPGSRNRGAPGSTPGRMHSTSSGPTRLETIRARAGPGVIQPPTVLSRSVAFLAPWMDLMSNTAGTCQSSAIRDASGCVVSPSAQITSGGDSSRASFCTPLPLRRCQNDIGMDAVRIVSAPSPSE